MPCSIQKYLRISILLMFVLVSFQSALAQDPLDVTYISPDGRLTFSYPAGWELQHDAGGYLLANDPTSFDAPSLVDGQIVVGFILFPSNVPTSDMDFQEVLKQAVIQQGFQNNEGAEPTALVYGVATGAEITLQIQDTMIMTHAMVPFDEFKVMSFTYITTPHDHELRRNLALDILATIKYDDNATPLTHVSDEGSVVWQVEVERASRAPLSEVRGLAVGPDDTIYIASGYAGVTVVNPSGQITDSFEVVTPTYNDAIEVSSIAVASDGTLWIADSGNSWIVHVDKTGKLLGTVGELGMEEGQFWTSGPTSLQIGPSGNLYAADFFVNKIVVFSPYGEWLYDVALADPYDLFTVAPDEELYMINTFLPNPIVVLGEDGTVIQEIQNPFGTPYLDNPAAIVFASDGTFWVTLPSESAIVHVDPSGKMIGKFGRAQIARDESFEQGEFSATALSNLRGIGILSNGDLVVGDMNDRYAQVVRVSANASHTALPENTFPTATPFTPMPTPTTTPFQTATPIPCTISTRTDVNLRSGPGTDFESGDILRAGQSAVAIGQNSSTGGPKWWRLYSGLWVRSDVVEEQGNCAKVPLMNP